MPSFDPTLILVVMIFAGYLVFGKIMEARKERRAELLPKQPICGCTDHLAFHNPATGRCEAQRREVVHWIRNPELDEWLKDDTRLESDRPKQYVAAEWELRQCACQRYTGPEPLGTLFAPELSTDHVERPRPVDPPREALGYQ